MFPVYCPRHGSTVLLGMSSMRRMVNVEPGVILLEFTCYDGEVVRLLTGRHVPGEVSVPSPDEHAECDEPDEHAVCDERETTVRQPVKTV